MPYLSVLSISPLAMDLRHILLLLLPIAQLLAEKTLCFHENASIAPNLYYYQRIELTDRFDCVERCIETAEYCRAALWAEEQKTKKRYCQLYGKNSEDLGRSIHIEGGDGTLYEILDKCTAGEAEKSAAFTEKLSKAARKALEILPAKYPTTTPKEKEGPGWIRSSVEFGARAKGEKSLTERERPETYTRPTLIPIADIPEKKSSKSPNGAQRDPTAEAGQVYIA